MKPMLNKHGIRILDSHIPNRHRHVIDKIRLSREYIEWAGKVLERDRGRCQSCGTKKLIQVHHKKPLHVIITEYRIFTLKEARKCSELWDTDNGEVLCEECHGKKHDIKEGELWGENIV